MALTAGLKLGPYEILAPLGKGGMGEVYRARDAKLDREVALKVLPPVFAGQGERLARFRREAQVLAALNHPNIASIYGLEDDGAQLALVMELVPGHELRGPLPVDDALALAAQICEGIEYAHERGIVHRDLKPANIKVTPEGAAKILDFGLAKALTSDDSAPADLANSPTLTHMASLPGMILGTAAYMAPEQAKGKTVDRRADIWAFGCVLFELLTGSPAFEGETATEILAAVITRDPDWNRLPPGTPAGIRSLLARCLTKDPRQRLQAIGEARILLTAADRADADDRIPARRAVWLPWALAALAATLTAVPVIVHFVAAPAPTPQLVTEIAAPLGTRLETSGNGAGAAVISPNGEQLAFTAVGTDTRQRIYVRNLATGVTLPLSGTESAAFEFWSADSRSLGFFMNGKLDRIAAVGGPVLTICAAPQGRGGDWSSDDQIIFTPDIREPVFVVPAAGGTPRAVTRLVGANTQQSDRWPQFLPDGRHFIFLHQYNFIRGDNAVELASLDNPAPRTLLHNLSAATYASGFLLFVGQGSLMAQPFDAARLRLTDEPRLLADHVSVNSTVARGSFSAAGNGLLLLQHGGAEDNVRMVWLDATGKEISQIDSAGGINDPSLSPDGHELIASRFDPSFAAFSLWRYDLVRGTQTRFTFPPGSDESPVWLPDGNTVAYSHHQGDYQLLLQSSHGATAPQRILPFLGNVISPAFAPDGRSLLFVRGKPGVGEPLSIWSLPLASPGAAAQPSLAIHSSGIVTDPSVSPDGKWVAYVSPNSGRDEVYVEPRNQSGGRYQVSTDGGKWPRWRRDGKMMYFMRADSMLIALPLNEQVSGLAFGNPQPLFRLQTEFGLSQWMFDPSSDGTKFVVVLSGAPAELPLTLIQNWPALAR